MRIYFKEIILILLILIFSACGDVVVTNKNSSDVGGDTEKPDDNIPIPPTEEDLNKLPFSLSPDNFTFPKTETNSISSSSIVIRNNFTSGIVISYKEIPKELTLVNSSATSACDAYQKPRKLKPNEQCFIELVFNPKVDDSFDDVFKLSYLRESDQSTGSVNLRYVARSVSALGDEVIAVAPDYLLFSKTITGLNKDIQTFTVQNKTNNFYNITTYHNLKTNYFSTDVNSECLKGLAPNLSCNLIIIFDKDNRINKVGNYEDKVAISAVDRLTGKGLSLTKPLHAMVKQLSAFKTNKTEHTFADVKTNYSDFDHTTVTLSSDKNISRVTSNFVNSNIIHFNSSAFQVDNVNCRIGITATGSCDLLIKFQPPFAITYQAILQIKGDSEIEDIFLTGTGVLSQDNSTSIKGLKASKNLVNISTEAGKKISDKILLSNEGDTALVLRFDYLLKDVYSISGCAGTILAVGDSCVLNIDFEPREVGSFIDKIIISANNIAETVSIGLNAIATAPNEQLENFTFNPPRVLDFGQVVIGTSSKSEAVLVTATINADFFEYDVTDSSAFNIISSTCLGSLSASATCNIVLSFTPNIEKKYSSLLRVYRADKVDSIEIKGEGMASANIPKIPGLFISSPSLIFTDTLINSITTAKNIYLKNTGTSDINLKYSSREVGKAVVFNTSSDCTSVLKPNEECLISIKFSPIDSVKYTDDIYITSGAVTDTISLIGTGVNKGINYNPNTLIKNLQVSKKRIDFIKTEEATRSVYEEIILTYNVSDARRLTYNVENKLPHIFLIDQNLTTCTFSFTGANPDGETCKLVYSFNPSAGEYYEDVVTITDTAEDGEKINIKLTGTGISYISSPNFGVVKINEAAKVQTVLFVNDSNFAYALGKVSVTDIARDGNKIEKGKNVGFKLLSTACENIKLLPGKSCQSIVSFKPTIDGDNGIGYQGRLIIEEAGGNKSLQLLGATKNNTLLKLDYWETGAPTVGWGTRVTAINNKIYSIGNENVLDHKKLREYNTATNKWRVVTPLGTSPYEDEEKIFPVGRNDGEAKRATKDYKYVSHAGIVSSGDKFFIFGGWLNSKDTSFRGGFSSNILSFYDQADTRLNPNGTWTKMQSLPTSLIPTPGRHGQSIALINNKIYAYSGRDIGSASTPDFLLYDIATSSWQNLTPKITGAKPSPAAFTAVLGYNGKLYVDGGNQSDTLQTKFWIFDPSNLAGGEHGTWTEITKGTPTEDRYIHSMVQIAGKIYIGGGDTNNKIYIFDTTDKTDNDYGSWKPFLAPLGYKSDKTKSGTDNKDSVMVNVDNYIWINYGNEMWVYYP